MRENVDARWARWGDELRRYRRLAELSQTELGDKVHLSKSMMSGLERGTRNPKRSLSESLDAHLSTGGALTRLWAELTQQRSVPEWFADAVLLERRASEIRQWQPFLVPGLLQTADYARAIVRAWHLLDGEDEVERLVESRIARLPAITRGRRPLLWFVVAARAFDLPLDEKIRKEQYQQIIDLVEAGVIRFQVLGHDVLGPGPTPPFQVFTLDVGDVVYTEHSDGGVVIDSPPARVRFLGSTIYGAMQAAAMGCDTSVKWLKELTV